MRHVPDPDSTVVADSANSLSVIAPSDSEQNALVANQALDHRCLCSFGYLHLPKQGMAEHRSTCEPEILQSVVVESSAKNGAMLLGLDGIDESEIRQVVLGQKFVLSFDRNCERVLWQIKDLDKVVRITQSDRRWRSENRWPQT